MPLSIEKLLFRKWDLLSRVNQPTAGVLDKISDADWGLVIWAPRPPMIFGQVAAVVCTADRAPEESRAIGRLLVAAPQLYGILDGLVCPTCGNRIGWNGAKGDLAYMDWRACATCKSARDLLAEIRDGQ